MTRRVLLCDCYLDTPGAAANFVPLLGGADVTVVRPAHESWRESAQDFDAIIISGSAASIVTPPPWEAPLEQLVQDAAATDTPTLGVCFGHQVIARALCGPSAVCTSTTAELGWFDVRHTASDPLFAGIDQSFRTFVSHREEVTPNTADLRVFASTPDCHNQAFRVPDRRLWGVQFHAEIKPAEASALIRSRAAKHPERQIDVGTKLSAAVDSSQVAQRIIDNFMGEL